MKNTKRLASLLLAIAMMFTLVFAHGNIFSAYAEGSAGYQAVLTANGNDIVVGDSITVQVTVSHTSQSKYSAGEFKVSYDANKVSFVSVANTVTGENAGIRAKAANGVVTVEDFGSEKNMPATYTLNFTAAAEGNARFALQSAAFIDKVNASRSDLIAIVNTPEVVTVAIDPAPFDVTVNSEYITGNNQIAPGATYTFTVADYDKYDYTFTATMGGQAVTPVAGENGTYTIAGVTGALVISASRVEKQFSVTINGTTADNDGNKATYNTDYSFTLPENIAPGVNPGANYSLGSVTIGGVAYSGTQHADGSLVYTIPGADIVGNVVINITETPVDATQFSVTVSGTGSGAAADFEATGTLGGDYILTITPAAGYRYEISATVNGNAATVVPSGNTYTVSNVIGALEFTVTRTVITDNVSIQQYVALDGTKMWLILQAQDLGSNNYATYNGQAMFYSSKYNAYAYLVIANNLSVEEAKALIGVGSGAASAISYSNDVNMTGRVDASDAQYVYNMYNAYYAGFGENETMNEFLLGDTNGDHIVNVLDAVVIINAALAP